MGEIPFGNDLMDAEAIISAAKDELYIEPSDNDISFDRWLNDGIRAFDCLSLFSKKICTLPVECDVAKLPRGFIRFLAVRVGKPPNCQPAIYVDLPFIKDCGCSDTFANTQPYCNSFQIQSGKIVFNQQFTVNADGEPEPVPIHDCTLAYFGMDLNCEGLLNINADMQRGLVAYICWKYCRRSRDPLNRQMMNEFKQEWKAQKKFIKSIQFSNDFLNNRIGIAEWANCIIADKLWND